MKLLIKCSLVLLTITIVFGMTSIIVNRKRHASIQKSDEALRQRFLDRQQLLCDKCYDLGLSDWNGTTYRPNMSHYVVNDKLGLIWCPVFKAASSTWLHYMSILAGYSEDFLEKTLTNKWKLIRQALPRPTLNQLTAAQDNCTTFLIVRHPFERILSGYCNKLASYNPYYNNLFGNKIIAAYRTINVAIENPEYPTFREFILWLIDLVARGEHVNEHFEPVTSYCSPCLIETDFVLKVETMQDDEAYFLKRTGHSTILKTKWKNQSNFNGKSLEHYYSQLTRADLERLIDYYKYDLALFNYSTAAYFQMLK